MTMTATDRDQDQDRKCDKMKLYSSGNCCYVEEARKKTVSHVRHLQNGRIFN